MTQEYKDTLLRYLTGNLNEETGVDTPQFSDLKTIQNNLADFIYTYIGSTSYSINDIIQGKSSENDGLNMYLLYGYTWATDDNFSFFIILDDNLTPIQYINEYSNGDGFEYFMTLNVDEEGKFYGIELVDQTTTPRKRFVMLNNILIKTDTQTSYSVKLRQSYNLPTPISNCTTFIGITKNPNTAQYLIGGTYEDNDINQPIATELIINVGAENTWTNYIYNDTTNFIGSSIYAVWDDAGNISFKMSGITYLTNNYYTEYTNEDDALSQYQIQLSIEPSGVKTKIINLETTYISYYYTSSSTIYLTINEIDYNNNAITKLISKTKDIGGTQGIFMQTLNGILFYAIDYYGSDLVGHTYIGMIENDNITEKYLGSSTTQLRRIILMTVSNQYNLYNIYGSALENTMINSTLIFNANNYNGESYENANSLTANSGALLDENSNPIFARNLYNNSVYSNVSLSVLQVPNVMLNNITISTQNLLGETNKTIVSNTSSLTKNIYETLYLNFYNTILMQDRNTLNYQYNQSGANRINDSASSTNDYTSAKATKYRINYQDNTSTIQNLVWYNIQNFYRTRISIYVSKLIDTIDIISADEETTYQTIDGSSLEITKTYNIYQDVYIDEKDTTSPLYYGEDELYYGEEQIYY